MLTRSRRMVAFVGSIFVSLAALCAASPAFADTNYTFQNGGYCLTDHGQTGTYSFVMTCESVIAPATQTFTTHIVGTNNGHIVFEIINPNNGGCQVGEKVVGHGVENRGCGGLPTGWEYRWVVLQQGDGSWMLQLLSSNMCMDENNVATTIVSTCNASVATQHWRV